MGTREGMDGGEEIDPTRTSVCQRQRTLTGVPTERADAQRAARGCDEERETGPLRLFRSRPVIQFPH